MTVGRDLVRLLQYVARIPEIEPIWKDILHNPAALHSTFTGKSFKYRWFTGTVIIPHVMLPLSAVIEKLIERLTELIFACKKRVSMLAKK